MLRKRDSALMVARELSACRAVKQPLVGGGTMFSFNSRVLECEIFVVGDIGEGKTLVKKGVPRAQIYLEGEVAVMTGMPRAGVEWIHAAKQTFGGGIVESVGRKSIL